MIVVAGPPGSGKTRYFPVTAFGVDAFNIDDRCAQVLGSYRAAAIDQAQLAREHGFATELIFIATDSVAENIARVLQRAQGGGHGASERDVRAIHEASVANLVKAIDVFERVDVYDSTARWSAPRLVATTHVGQIARLGATPPAWLDRALSTREP